VGVSDTGHVVRMVIWDGFEICSNIFVICNNLKIMFGFSLDDICLLGMPWGCRAVSLDAIPCWYYGKL
jgi:hypothetical protein